MARVLYLTSVLPWPLQRNGGGRRTTLIRRALTELGHDVTTLAVMPAAVIDDELVAHADEADVAAVIPVPANDRPTSRAPGPIGSMRMLGRQYANEYSAHPDVVAEIRAHLDGGDYDLLVVRYGWTMSRCGLPASAGDVPVLLDFDDIDWVAMQSRFAAEPWPGLGGRLGMKIAVSAVRKRVQRASGECAGRWVACDEDAAALSRIGMAATTLPNIPAADADDDVPKPLPRDPGGQRVLFVGDLQHGPNKSGLDRFVCKIWPQIHATLPDACFRIVGRGMSDEQRGAWSIVPGIEPIGFAQDVRVEYEQAAVTVAPSWWGGGTKIKVVEAAALGRAQVVTPAALRGFAPLLGNTFAAAAVLSADEDGDFADAVVKLLRDDELRQSLARSGPLHVRRHYAFEAFRQGVETLVDTALGGRGGAVRSAPEAVGPAPEFT